MYNQPALTQHADWEWADRILVISNKTGQDLEYWVYNDDDGIMLSSLQKNTLPAGEITYYKNQYNFNRTYRVYAKSGESIAIARNVADRAR